MHVYVPGTFVKVPSQLLKYKKTFRKIGNNLFIRDTSKMFAVQGMTLRELTKKFGDTATLSKVSSDASLKQLGLSKMALEGWRRATDKEAILYKKAVEDFDSFVQQEHLKLAREKLRQSKSFLKESEKNVVRANKRISHWLKIQDELTKTDSYDKRKVAKLLASRQSQLVRPL